LLLVAVVTLVFALLALVVRGVNLSGAVAGGAACFCLFAGAGPGAFAALVALFLVTWVSTRLGYEGKVGRGLAERREGRNAWQVLANLSVPSLAALAFAGSGARPWMLAVIAALAEAATDTVASEIGQYRRPDALLITTWRVVPAGMDGGITLPGSVAGAAAGIVVAAVALLGGVVPLAVFWIPVVAACLGMLFDSLLGATVQSRGWMGNQAVNFLATLAAAILAFFL
jgi:uncharacterized protein (TIGR00297 family)